MSKVEGEEGNVRHSSDDGNKAHDGSCSGVATHHTRDPFLQKITHSHLCIDQAHGCYNNHYQRNPPHPRGARAEGD